MRLWLGAEELFEVYLAKRSSRILDDLLWGGGQEILFDTLNVSVRGQPKTVF